MPLHNAFPLAAPPAATGWPHAAEHLTQACSAFMARHWPLLVAAVYLDCAAGLFLSPGHHELAQIAWHLAAIALTQVLAALGGNADDGGPLHPRPRPRRAYLEMLAAALLLPALLGLGIAAWRIVPPHPLPLHAPMRILVGACSLVLVAAVLARLARLRGGLRLPHGEAMP